MAIGSAHRRREGPRFIQVHGIVTESDVLTKVSQLTGNLLSPPGNQGYHGRQVERSRRRPPADPFYDQLLELGFSPVEAELILQKDWETLQQISREAFFTALVDKLGGLPSYPGGIPCLDRMETYCSRTWLTWPSDSCRRGSPTGGLPRSRIGGAPVVPLARRLPA